MLWRTRRLRDAKLRSALRFRTSYRASEIDTCGMRRIKNNALRMPLDHLQ